jgi:hypothetical protein
MASSFKSPILQAIDQNGNPVPGAKLFAFASGTTTPVVIYSNQSLTTPLPNPLIANARGYFASAGGIVQNIWWDEAPLRLRLTNADDSVVWEIDNYIAESLTTEGNTQVARVIAEGDLQQTRVLTEGNTQVARLDAEATNQIATITAAASAEFFDSIAAGLAGTTDGEFFIVADDAGGDTVLTLYQNDSGTEDSFGIISTPSSLTEAGEGILVRFDTAPQFRVKAVAGDAGTGTVVTNGSGAAAGNIIVGLSQGLRATDSPTFGGLTFGTARDPIPGARHAYLDAGGRLIKYLDRDGRERFGAGVRFIEQTENLRDPNEFVFSIVTEDSRLLLGFDDEGNATIPGFAGGGGGGGSYTPPSDFSTSYLVGNIRTYNDVTVATRHDGTFSYDVRRNGTSEPAVIQHYEPAIAVFVYGQSNAGYGGDDGGPELTAKVFPNTCFSFASRITASGGAAVAPETLTGVRVLADIASEVNQLPATMAAFALESTTRENDGQVTPGIFTWTSWQGGQEITEFERDTTNWDNLFAGVSRIGPVMSPYGRTVDCPAVVYIQGEADAETVGYQALIEALADDLCPEVQTVMDLAVEPKFLLLQTNTSETAPTQRQPRLDQVAAARDNARINLAGPMYQCPLVDNIHQNVEGKMMQGEVMAEAIRIIRRDGSFTPLWPVSAVRTGAVVDVEFAVPAGPLAFDADFVPAVSNEGFRYKDSTTSATISSVAILNSNTVRITLNTTPTGTGQAIEYAAPISTAATGFASGRGTLYSPSETPSLYARLGYSVPTFYRHYAVSFEQEITT